MGEQKYPTFFSDEAEMNDEAIRIAETQKGSAHRREPIWQVVHANGQSGSREGK